VAHDIWNQSEKNRFLPGIADGKRYIFGNSKWHLHCFQIRDDANPAFHNSHALLKRIDSLPFGAKWKCTSFTIKGDRKDAKGRVRTEEVELWHRDPVECIAELLGNPAFKANQAYAPHRVFKNADGSNREYSEMWTCNWWWDIQVSCAIRPR
jgi:hypothetical protein